MQSSTKGSNSLGKRRASVVGPWKDQDASSTRSNMSQDTAMSDVDASMSKSVQAAGSDAKRLRLSSGLAKLVFGANIETIRIDTIRSSNTKAQRLRNLVVVFIGGTDGIGESTALELFRRTVEPKAYIIGRNPDKGRDVVRQMKNINPGGEAVFVQKDVSSLKNVDEVCQEIKHRESKINCLFLTAGYMSLKSRDETIEGIDRKMSMNYYARIRFALKLTPLLQAASDAGELSRVISVLAAGSEADVRLDDLDLRHSFSLHTCLAHCALMTDFMMEELARRFPTISFSHSYPGTIKTGIANELTGPVRLAVKVLYAVVTPWILNVQESGERHLFQITSQCYPAAEAGRGGVEIPHGLHVIRGSDGQVGSGAYLLDWDGKPTGDRKVIEKYRAMNFGKLVWEHTMQIFEQAEQRTRPPAVADLADSREKEQRIKRSQPANRDPVGWRAG